MASDTFHTLRPASSLAPQELTVFLDHRCLFKRDFVSKLSGTQITQYDNQFALEEKYHKPSSFVSFDLVLGVS